MSEPLPDAAQSISLVQSGGPVLVTVVVLSVIFYLGWKLVLRPGLKEHRLIEETRLKVSEEHAKAAECNASAARANQAASEANARTAGHLERMSKVFEKAMEVAIGGRSAV